RKETFADWQRLEREIATELEEWKVQALPVGANEANQELLVGAVKTLLQDLQADARSRLDEHLASYDRYVHLSSRLKDEDVETAAERLETLRGNVMTELQRLAPLVGLDQSEVDAFRDSLRELERDPFVFLNTKELLGKTLEIVNKALERKFAGNKR